MSEAPAVIESQTQFADTPQGRQQYWTVEVSAARDNVKEWWADGERVIKEFLGERTESGKTRLNLYYADVTTKAANMSGLPKVRARRRHADALDDVARVSADALERLLNTDIDRDEDGYRKSLNMARDDWQRPGLGAVRFRYVAEFEPTPEQPAQMGPCQTCGGAGRMQDMAGEMECPACEAKGEVELAPAVPAGERKTFEDVETDYVHWKDFLWSPCKTWSDCRWIGYRIEMTRDALVERFGDKGKKVPLHKRQPKEVEGISEQIKDAWSRAEVWELWAKESKTRVFFAEGMDEILEEEEDPLGVPGFFPSPEPLCANGTTSKWIPRPNYFLAEHLYEEAHDLTRRIRLLVKAIKVNGGYDAANQELRTLLDESVENTLVPVKGWAALAEKGGFAAAVGFLPIEPQVQAVVALVQQRNLVKQDLYEITGQSDIMRGQAAQKATATEQRIKARFGSSRIQAEQDEFARFASEGQRIRASIICKHFDPETIVKRSNIDKAADPQILQQAIQLLKDDFAAYRVEVDAESLSMTDFDAVQQEAVTFMQATGEFFKAWLPLVQMGGPPMAQFAMELYQQFAAQLRGAERFEGIIDRQVAQLKQMAAQPPKPPPPDPKVEAEKIKAGAVQQKAQVDMQKSQMDLQVAKAKTGLEIEKMHQQVQANQMNAQTRIAEAQAMPREPAEVE